MNTNLILFIVVILLVSGDKITTYYSLKNLQKNNPNVDYLSAERNPLAKFFLGKLGLGWGNFVYAIISIITFYIALYLMRLCLKGFGVTNYIGIPYYIMFMVYGFVLANNLYFVLKHGRILP
jgi:type IV secretory pathway VirB6-like protein